MTHRIQDISYAPHDGPSWSLCTCGVQLNARTPEALQRRWNAHRGGKGGANVEPIIIVRAGAPRCHVAGCENRADGCFEHNPNARRFADRQVARA